MSYMKTCKDCGDPETYKQFPRCHSCHKAERRRVLRAWRAAPGGSKFPERAFTCSSCRGQGVTTSPTRTYCEPCSYARKLGRNRVKVLSDATRMRLHWDRVSQLEAIKSTAEGELLDLIVAQEKDDRRTKIKYQVSLDTAMENV